MALLLFDRPHVPRSRRSFAISRVKSEIESLHRDMQWYRARCGDMLFSDWPANYRWDYENLVKLLAESERALAKHKRRRAIEERVGLYGPGEESWSSSYSPVKRGTCFNEHQQMLRSRRRVRYPVAPRKRSNGYTAVQTRTVKLCGKLPEQPTRYVIDPVRAERRRRKNIYCRLLKQLSQLPEPLPAEFWVTEQGGADVSHMARVEMRHLREVHQRRIAQLKQAKLAEEGLSKKEKQKARSKKRDQKYTVEEQSGAFSKAGALFGSVVAAVTLGKLAKKGVTKAVKAFEDGVANIKNQLKVFWESVSKKVHSSFLVAIVSTLFAFVIFKADLPEGLTAMLIAALTVVVATPVVSKLSELLRKERGATVAQGGWDALPHIFATMLTFSIFGEKGHRNKVGELLKRVSMIERASSGFSTLITWLMKATEASVNWFRSVWGKEPISFGGEEHAALRSWIVRVDAAQVRSSVGEEDLSAEEVQKLVGLVVEGSVLRDAYRAIPGLNVDVERGLIKAFNLVQPHLGGLCAKNNRMEPIMAVVLGEPGSGKTQMLTALAFTAMVASGLVPPEEVEQNLWQKGTSQYLNGYVGQFCMCFDDIWQQLAFESDKDNDYINIIRMVGPWSFPLNMADLASKGKIYFNSKLILATTNLESIVVDASKVINKPGAVVRRIAFPVRISVNPQYRVPGTERIDYRKLEEEKQRCAEGRGLDAYPWYIWSAETHNFETGNSNGQTKRSMRDVVQEIVDELKLRAAKHADERASLPDFINRLKVEPQSADIQLEPVVEQAGREAGDILGEIHDVDDEEVERVVDDFYERWRDIYSAQPIGSAARDVLNRFQLDMVPIIDAFAEHKDVRRFYEEGWRAFEPYIPELRQYAQEAKLRDRGFFKRLVDAMLGGYLFIVSSLQSWEEGRHRVQKLLCYGTGAFVCIGILWLGIRMLYALVKGTLSMIGAWPKKQRTLIIDEPNIVESQSQGPKQQGSRRPKIHEVVNQCGGSAVSQTIFNNSWNITLPLKDGVTMKLGQMLCLEHDLAVMPMHFILHMRHHLESQPDAVVHLVPPRDKMPVFSVSVRQFLSSPTFEMPEDDLVFISFATQGTRNITKFFLTEKDIRTAPNMPAWLEVAPISGSELKLSVSRHSISLPGITELKDLHVAPAYQRGEIESRKYRRCFKYSADTKAGYCGSALLVDGTYYNDRTICGLHIAGAPGRREGMATIVTREMVEKAVKALRTIRDKFEDTMPFALSQGGEFVFSKVSTFSAIGKLDKAVHISPYTRLYDVPSTFGFLGETPFRPAFLRPFKNANGELVLPMEHALDRYGTEVKRVDRDWLDLAVHIALKPTFEATRTCTRNILTFDESVVGVPAMKLNGIPRGTSAGFPYIFDVKIGGKKDFFGDGVDYDLDTDRCRELRERVQTLIEAAERGERYAHVFTDFLKDEELPVAKVMEGRTRLISAAPLDYTIVWRQYFGAFSSALMRNHTVIGMAPGINVYQDWGVLREHLKKKGLKVFDGDFKAFDASEQPDVHKAILKKVNEWYNDGPVNARVREVLFMDLYNSRHIGGDGRDQSWVYEWAKSLPSGHPFTTTVNSIYSLVCLVGAYIELTGDLTGFWTYVSPVTYGDDNAVNVADEAASVYNQVTVSHALKHVFHMDYTPGRKDGVWVPTCGIEDISFLKRGFRLAETGWVAPLEVSSVLFSCYRFKNRRREKEEIPRLLEKMLEELALHPQEIWDQYAQCIADKLAELGHETAAPLKRREYLRVVGQRVTNW